MSRTFTIRIRARWLTYTLVAALTAAVVAPAAVWAADKFTDVPDTHTFHDDITWLADAGITKGCNPPDNTLYCPEDSVTRGQMAAFMKRFAGYLDAEDGTPGNADTVAGVVPAAGSAEVAWSNVSSTTPVTLDTIDITVPAAGTIYIQVAGNIFLNYDSPDTGGVTAVGYLGICTEADTLDTTKCSPEADRGIFYQDPDNNDDSVLFGTGGPNATPGTTRTLVYEAASAGTYTFYINGYGTDVPPLLVSATAVPYYSYGMSASAVFLPATLTITSASGGAGLAIDQATDINGG